MNMSILRLYVFEPVIFGKFYHGKLWLLVLFIELALGCKMFNPSFGIPKEGPFGFLRKGF